MGERLRRILERADELVLVAAAPDGTVMGWAHGAEQRFLESASCCELLGLVVDREWRRHGVGRALVAAMEAWARTRGVTRISVRSNVARVESHPFYEGIGYTRAKTQHMYLKPLPPSLVRRPIPP